MNKPELICKMATEPSEFDQIYQLNYKTFVEEIKQHETNSVHKLVDKFHDENTYIIAKRENEVVGMIAIRSNRPFSLDQKLSNLDTFLPEDAVPCEIRLLSVKEKDRSTRVFYQLSKRLVSYCLEKKYTIALISGTVGQLKLYKRMGFSPFGPMVGTEKAKFQPMYLTRENFEQSTKAYQRLMEKERKSAFVQTFLPGPVSVHSTVKEAFSSSPLSHRNGSFIQEMKELQDGLCELTNANHAQVMVGTGTFSNDVVAAQLKDIRGEGLILANGEFGYRLIDHALRMDLNFQTIEKEWEQSISLDEVDRLLQRNSQIKWIWTVHCETSTGYLIDLDGLLTIGQKHEVEVCVDACSSVGVVPVNFQKVYLATTVSGKGLGSFPGLAIVFHRDNIEAKGNIPRYLDLGMYNENQSIPFTHSSNHVKALIEALKFVDYPRDKALAEKVRKELSSSGFNVLCKEFYSPGIVTIALPTRLSSKRFGDRCRDKGILISYESDYLLVRNWVQIALMGVHNERDVLHAITLIKQEMSVHTDSSYV
ncbi:aminotransferase class V-fold PLP-dependent enzyme [Bacillus sp. 2205SS5-2]|uniref:aminotransferase class V-fold PLP-dependent enzyme n=1 Tax=Bacillus sp. 2205SS5-2 TaxID=3109031 RepID=UPI00300722D6